MTTDTSPIMDRYKDLPWAKVTSNIVIGGVGGIGSWLSILLSRLNPANTITLYDPDIVEAHNIGGQFYMASDVGRAKVNAVADIIMDFSQKGVYKYTSLVEKKQSAHTFFSCFDNMKARREMIEHWITVPKTKTDGVVHAFIDGRMTGEQGTIYVVNSKRRYERYMDEFKDDDQIDDLGCSVRATSHNCARIASEMTGVYTNLCFNKTLSEEEKCFKRETPFKIEYDFPLLNYKTTP